MAKIDNNWGGMTWSSTYVGNPKISKSKGSKRPASEGGHYIRYDSVEDFFEDWVKDLECDVLESKELLQEALLLGNDGIPIGWVMAFDLEK